MALAAYVEREMPEAEVSIVDMKIAPDGVAGVERAVAAMRPTVIGFSAMTLHAGVLHETATAVRKIAPDALMVAGGPYANCLPDAVLANPALDTVVLGEGEFPLLNILRARRDGRPIEGLKAVITRGGGIRERDPVGDLDRLPSPAWHKVNLDAYRRYPGFTVLGRRNYMSLFTSRACPYQCAYCHKMFGNNFRSTSAEQVLDQIRTLKARYGITNFDILDDVFNLNRRRAVDVCQGIIRERLNVRLAFGNGLRADLLDDELLSLMRDAGAVYISFAIETASPRLQQRIGKNLDIDKAIRSIETAARLRILSNGFFMLGFPTETESEMLDTVRLAVRLPLDIAHFAKVTPFDGTPMYEQIDPSTKEYLKTHPDAGHYQDRTFNLSAVPNDRFNEILRFAMLRFYLNPRRLARTIRNHPEPWKLLDFAGQAYRGILAGKPRA